MEHFTWKDLVAIFLGSIVGTGIGYVLAEGVKSILNG